MKMKVTKRERSLLPKWSLIARSALEDIKFRRIFINLNDSSTSFTECECIRVISETVEDSAERNLLLKCLVDAEVRSPGASFVFLSMLAGHDNDVPRSGNRFDVDQIHKSLNSITEKDVADIVLEAVKLAGRKGKIFLDENKSNVTEISYGSQISKWKPSSDYFNSIGQSKVSVQNCRVVFIDGIIESVSECHRLFNDSYEKKVPIVIFARGFAEEVVATAAVNMQRQTAQIVPITIPFDEVGVNGMADLAKCFSSELISSDKGQLISNVDVSSCSSVDRISCSSSGTEIEYKDSKVNEVVKNLTSRLSNDDQEKSDLLRRRLNFLGSGAVTIKIGNEKKSLRNITKDRIDFGIRYVKSCMTCGVCEFNGILLPHQSVKAGMDGYNSFKNLVQNCAIVLEADKCG